MEEQTSNAGQGLGIAALVLGIVALILAFIPCFGWIALIPGIIAIILAVVALSQASQARAPKGLIIAALVISILGTSVAAVWGVIIGTLASHGDQWGENGSVPWTGLRMNLKRNLNRVTGKVSMRPWRK